VTGAKGDPVAISVDGIITGLDTSSLISELVDAYSIPKTLLEEDVGEYELLQEGLTGLSDRLEDLSRTLEGLQDLDQLRSFSVSYVENDAFIATVDGSAVEGTVSVEVHSLADSEMEVSDAFSDKTSTGIISEGTLSITYAGTQTDITVDSTNSSLVDLATEISDVEGLTAYVMDTGDATTPYRLVVVGDDTGSESTISIDTSGLTGAGTAPTFTEQSTAADASLTINGISVSSSDNKVTGVIEGLELELTGVSTEETDVTIALDTDQVEAQVESFISAYNEIIGYINDNSFSVEDSSDGASQGTFVGESSVRRIVSKLRSVITSQFSDMGTDIDSLSLIGVSTNTSDGTLSLDSDDFQTALADYQDSVEGLFTSSSGFGQTMIDALDFYIDPLEGSIVSRTDSIDDLVEDLEDQIDTWETRIESYEDRLRSSFTSLESTAGKLQGTSMFLDSYFFSDEDD